jgi:hypothetical protein
MARKSVGNTHSLRSKVEQLNLFTVKRNVAHLEALNSPRRAFYRIWIPMNGRQAVVSGPLCSKA